MTSQTPFDFAPFFNTDLPAPSEHWNGFPTYNFVGGHNAPESIPVDDFIKACTDVLKREGSTLATYRVESGPLGYLPLREFLVEKLKRHAGIECDTENILLTTGSSQILNLVNQLFLSPGDAVVAEQSNYGGVLSRFTQLKVDVHIVPVDQDGMQTDKLAETLARLKDKGVTPKYIYTIPTIHNPTGTIMSLERRVHLLELAREYDVPVFEDECYSDIIWDGQRPPSLYALSPDSRVIHTSTFSKSIAPALRVGYAVADWAVISRLASCKADAGSGALEQMMLAEYCHDHFDGHIAKLNVLLKEKLDVLVEALNEQFGTAAEFDVPPGGIFLWVRLPEAVNTTRLMQVANQQGVAINPGAEWSHDLPDGERCLRLCFANPSHDQLRAGVAKLAEICRDEFGVPLRSGNIEA